MEDISKLMTSIAQGSHPVPAVTGGSAATRLAPGYFPGVPEGRPVLRQSRRLGPTHFRNSLARASGAPSDA